MRMNMTGCITKINRFFTSIRVLVLWSKRKDFIDYVCSLDKEILTS